MKSGAMICPDCGTQMNHHANKIVCGASGERPGPSNLSAGEYLQELHSCPKCGANASRVSPN
jgi:ribosomal protein S27AE